MIASNQTFKTYAQKKKKKQKLMLTWYQEVPTVPTPGHSILHKSSVYVQLACKLFTCHC